MFSRDKHRSDQNFVRVASNSPLIRRQWVRIILGGVLVVLLVVPPITYIIWQIQARAVVNAFTDDVVRSSIKEDIPDSTVDDGRGEGIDEKPVIIPRDGTLRINGANIDMPIFRSSDGRVLYSGAWSPLGSALPGEVGNAVIFGHRFLNLPPSKNTMFNLHKVNVGDIIDIERDGVKYRYKVTESFVVSPEQVSVMENTDIATLTLITCTPIFSTTNRLVIKATLVE